MKKLFAALVLGLSILLLLASCGGGDTPPETSNELDRDEIIAVCSPNMFNNVTVRAITTVDGKSAENFVMITTGGYYSKAVVEGVVMSEYYCEHKDGKYYAYNKIGEEWIRTELEEHKDHSYGIGDVSTLEFAYDKENDEYDVSSADGANTGVFKIKDGYLVSFTSGDGTNGFAVSYTDYGKTEITFPKASVNEGEDGTVELPIVPIRPV